MGVSRLIGLQPRRAVPSCDLRWVAATHSEVTMGCTESRSKRHSIRSHTARALGQCTVDRVVLVLRLDREPVSRRIQHRGAQRA
jgi:broad-specificity NMP kinase